MPPTGEESCDDAVAPKRSRRRRPSGRSAHHQRPFGRGLEQRTYGDQGDPEGPEGMTGQAPPAMKSPLAASQAKACAFPCPAASRLPPPYRCWSASVMAAIETNFERGQQLGQESRRSGLRIPEPLAHLGDDPTARPKPWSLCPTNRCIDDCFAKARRCPGPSSRRIRMPQWATIGGCRPCRTTPAKCKHPPTKPPEGANESAIFRRSAERPCQSIAWKISPASGWSPANS